MMLPLVPAIILSSVVTAVACALVGSFLMLRRMSMMGEAIGHAMLPGLVLGLLVLGPMGSPQLVLGPAIIGLLMVVAVEALGKTRALAGDSALGLIYPLLFSIGVILVSRRFAGLPITEHSILIGDINFAAATPLYAGELLLGPRPLVVMGAILMVNALFVSLFYKELKITTFDPAFGGTGGFHPSIVHYTLMTLVSMTVVGAFEAVGAVLVVALLIGPPASAFLLTRRLHAMIALAALIGAGSAVAGFILAYHTDSATSGTMAMMIGAVFLLVFLVAPKRGVFAHAFRLRRNRKHFAEQMLMLCLDHHGGGQQCAGGMNSENIDSLAFHIGWSPEYTSEVVRRCINRRMVTHHHGVFVLTPKGKDAVSSLSIDRVT